MLMPLLLVALAAGAPAVAAQDTTVPVERGTRLHVEHRGGEVLVAAWSRDAVRVRATDLDGRQRLDVAGSGSVLRVGVESGWGGGDADLEISIPEWMDVRIEGNQLDVGVAGTAGEVIIETVGGDIVVEGGEGLVAVRTIEGEIAIRGARGRIEASSANDDITVMDVGGDLQVEATNGDISLLDIRSTSTVAVTVNGDVSYDGTIRDDGRYRFTTHNGDLSVAVPPGTNASVTVTSVHGEFESEFPVRLTGATRDRQFHFTLGSGSARLELESFNGDIRLRR